MQESAAAAAAATVGSPVGKISAALWSGVSLSSLSMRGRGLSEHTKGKKRHNNQQRITGGMEGRTEEKRERGKQHMRS